MRSRQSWLMALLVGAVLVLLTATPVLGAAAGPARSVLAILLTAAAGLGAARNTPSRPAVGWLLTVTVAANAANIALGLDAIWLVLLGFIAGLGAILLILHPRRAGFGPAAAIDALTATTAPFLLIVAVALNGLPADGPVLLVGNFTILLLVIVSVCQPYKVPPALLVALGAITLSTVTDLSLLLQTPLSPSAEAALLQLQLLLVAGTTLHPTFAAITTPERLTDQRHRAARLLVLAASIGLTLLLTMLEDPLIERSDAIVFGPLWLLLGLIGLRIVEWIRLLSDVAAQERLAAQTDPLTGLLSVQGLRTTAQEAAPHGPWSMVAIDLDRFRLVNEAFGTDAGDAALGAVAETLTELIPGAGALARLTADEFAFLLPGDDRARAHRLARAAVAAIGEPIHAGPMLGWVSLRASAGVAVDGGDAPSVESDHAEAEGGQGQGTRSRSLASYVRPRLPGIATRTGSDEDSVAAQPSEEGPGVVDRLMRDALTAVSHAQRRTHRPIEDFRPRMAQSATADILRLRDLQRALAPGAEEIQPGLQPIVDLTTGRAVAVEALARWTLPDGTAVAPHSYLELAEASGWIVQLGRRMLRRACEELAVLRDQHPDLRVQVNVSPIEAAQPGFVESAITIIGDAGLPLEAVIMEVTEQVLLPNASEALTSFTRLAAMGVGLSVDDFGSGYASIGYLSRLPLATVKIDSSFIAELGEPDALLVDLLPFLTARGATVIAEGVETQEQVEHLVALGCRMGQGFHLGRPVPAAELELTPTRS